MTTILIILLCLMLSAFFSGMEIAYISANRMQIELEGRKDDFISRIVNSLIDKPKRFIITLLLGNNIVLVIYSILMEQVLAPHVEAILGHSLNGLVLLVQTLISTIIVLFLGEFTPKVLFRNFANEALRVFAIPSFALEKLFLPLSWLTVKMTSLFLKLFGGDQDEDEELQVREELRFFISEHLDEAEQEELDTEIQIFHNALSFADIKARECMVPRNEICAMELTDDMEQLKEKFVETGYSKILIYRDKIDDIIGYVHSFELFKKPPNIRSVLLPVEMVHEALPAMEALNLLLQKKKSLAVVLDEYGGTAGMLTVEDIVEELFGEIEDEHDQQDELEKQISDNEYLFSARLEVDYINEKYGLDLPVSESYETLGGLLFQHFGEIPEVGKEERIEANIIKATKVSETKVEEVKIYHLED